MIIDISSEYKNVLIIHTRWKMYLNFLESNGDAYSQVFVTDIRDVIFQGDVFEAFKGHKNYLGYSTEADDIGGSKTDDKCNYNWLIRAFGQEEADKLTNKQIICCGTVIGTVNEMKLFCSEMWSALATDKHWGNEQAQMNYFVHNNLLSIENLIEIDVESGEILTVALFRHRYPITIRDDMIQRGDGGIPAVVHQYDRDRKLIQLVDRVYRDKNFRSDEKFSDIRSNLEQIRQLLSLDKINDAASLFLRKFSADANFDANVDRLLKIWEALFNKPTFEPAVVYLELSIQSILSSVKNLSVGQLNTICARLNHSIKNKRIVAPQFIQFVVRDLLNTGEQSLNARNKDICSFCTETVNALPPDKNLYLLQAETYRALKKKDEALEAYRRAFEAYKRTLELC